MIVDIDEDSLFLTFSLLKRDFVQQKDLFNWKDTKVENKKDSGLCP
jgi:hypothetical protein